MVAAIGVGLIGTGYMDECHALAWNNVATIFGDVERSSLVHFAERDVGFARALSDWRDLLADPDVEVVSIATPNRIHADRAIAALQADKPVWCEKPTAAGVRIERSVHAMAQSFAERRWVDVAAP